MSDSEFEKIANMTLKKFKPVLSEMINEKQVKNYYELAVTRHNRVKVETLFIDNEIFKQCLNSDDEERTTTLEG